jgi:site-specific recombinase XerD
MSAKERTKPSLPAYAKLVKGYLGFLVGTGKSSSTVSSYNGDLSLLESFLTEKKKDFYRLVAKDFEAYEYWMEKQGLRINTRRRKILSAKALVKYAVSRKKMALTEIQYVKAPDRLERLPWIPLPKDWEKIQSTLNQKTPLGLRNTLLVHLLVETGFTVAELCALRWDNIEGGTLSSEGKRPRKIALSPPTKAWLSEWKEKNSGKHLFPGFNRHGPTSEKMTPRGVELFFRHLAKNTGLKHLKPKTLRHFAIVSWLEANLAESEIQQRLGVHSAYSFDAYRKHLETR